jgi:hypothetical protein
VQQSHAQDYAEFVPFMRARYNCSGADPDEPTSACPVVLFGGSYGGSAPASRSAQPPVAATARIVRHHRATASSGIRCRMGYHMWDCAVSDRAVWYTMPTRIRGFMRCVISCRM